MKQVSFFTHSCVPVLRLAICGLLIASANQSVKAKESNSPSQSGIFANSAADGGRLVIRRSPTLGDNVAISIYIDGKPAGTLVRARTFDKYIRPGRHILTASPNHPQGIWEGTLNVRRGGTFSYTASYNVDRLVLTPVSGSR